MTSRFVFHPASFEADSVIFTYLLEHENQRLTFTEKLQFPSVDFPSILTTKPHIQQLANHLGILLGISYWKLFCPHVIELDGFALNGDSAAFFDLVYTKGLGEFFYKNNIDFQGLIKFPSVDTTTSPPAPTIQLQQRALLLIGGGKDSIVSAELVKKSGFPFTAFMLSSTPLQQSIVEHIGVSAMSVNRQLDPQLFELNKGQKGYNGHIPISAIYGFVSVFAAVLFDYKYVIASNEHSSNYGNIKYLEKEINHQWSKSFEFESRFALYLDGVLGKSVAYFSLLRPLSELAITQEFINYPKYFPIFSSCNRNFSLHQEQSKKPIWCGRCPKCAFVFVLLAAYLPKTMVIHIFGKDLLADPILTSTYQALLGITPIKPFECVGTPDEVCVAFAKIHDKHEYDGEVNVDLFLKEKKLTAEKLERMEKELLIISSEHLIPPPFQKLLLAL